MHSAVHIVGYIVQCSVCLFVLWTVHYLLCNVQCACVLCYVGLPCALCIVQCALCIVQVLCNVHCVLCYVHCVLCYVHCVLCYVHCVLLNCSLWIHWSKIRPALCSDTPIIISIIIAIQDIWYTNCGNDETGMSNIVNDCCIDYIYNIYSKWEFLPLRLL